MFSRSLFALLIGSTVAVSTGCAGLSFQSYGSTTRGHSVSQGAAKADVIASMGEPDSVFKGEDTEVFVYKGFTGANYFGIWSTIKRDDSVVVMDKKGTVMTVVPVEVGRGTTIFSPAWLDATHPVPSKELTESPENYNYEYKEEAPAK